MSVSETIGCIVVVCMASGLTGLLLWIAGSSRDIPPTRLRSLLLRALCAVLAAVGGLGLARWYGGGSLFDFNAHAPAGFTTRPVGLAVALVDLAALLWALACLWYVLRIAGRITGPPAPRPSHGDTEE